MKDNISTGFSMDYQITNIEYGYTYTLIMAKIMATNTGLFLVPNEELLFMISKDKYIQHKPKKGDIIQIDIRLVGEQ